MDKKNSKELIEFILLSITLIEERFERIHGRDDFLEDHNGLEKLDAISMRLQSIGEAIKNILKSFILDFPPLGLSFKMKRDYNLFWGGCQQLFRIILTNGIMIYLS